MDPEVGRRVAPQPGKVVRVRRQGSEVFYPRQARLAETQTLATAVELAGAVAHNLRNPLASIRVSAEMLQDGTSEPAETTEHCQDITSAVDRADRWITELVRVSQAPQLQDEAVALGPDTAPATSGPSGAAPEQLVQDALLRLGGVDPLPPRPRDFLSGFLGGLRPTF